MTSAAPDTPSTERRTPRFRPLPVTLAVAALVVVADQWSKHWALDALGDGSRRHVIWTLQFNLTRNSGMAFSTGTGAGRFIGIAAMLVIVAIVFVGSRVDSRTVAVAAGLVLGGAIGNLVDRAARGSGFLGGAVIDFIDFQWFPIFNVADIGVDVGAGIFVVWSLVAGRHREVIGSTTDGGDA